MQSKRRKLLLQRLCLVSGILWTVSIIALLVVLENTPSKSMIFGAGERSWIVIDVEQMQLGFMYSQLLDEEEIRRQVSLKDAKPKSDHIDDKILAQLEERILDHEINPGVDSLTDYVHKMSNTLRFGSNHLWFWRRNQPMATIPYQTLRTQVELLHTVFYVNWPLAMLPAIILFLISVRPTFVRRHRLRYGLCVECGYNLSGLTGNACPECGAAVGSGPAIALGEQSQTGQSPH